MLCLILIIPRRMPLVSESIFVSYLCLSDFSTVPTHCLTVYLPCELFPILTILFQVHNIYICVLVLSEEILACLSRNL